MSMTCSKADTRKNRLPVRKLLTPTPHAIIASCLISVAILNMTPLANAFTFQLSRTGTTFTRTGIARPLLFACGTTRTRISTRISTCISTRTTTTRLYSSSSTHKNRRGRKEDAKSIENSQNMQELNWDHYDFSNNPKQDNRFGNGSLVSSGVNLDVEEEAKEDQRHAKKMNDANNAYLKLDPEVIARATEVLEPFINEDRLKRVAGVLKQRTKRSKFLFENPSNPSNVWACLRTIDSFGMQNVDLVIDSGRYAGKQAISQKKGMRTAMGSAQWLTLTNHGTTAEAIRQIKEVEGYKIYASDLNPNSKDVREVDWDAGPICVVMGNEDRGISEEMRELADETFTLPMSGFAESFNLSVATSITLAHMSAKCSDGKGPLRPGDMDEHEYNCLYLKGLLNSMAQKRTGQALLKQNNVVLPDALKDI